MSSVRMSFADTPDYKDALGFIVRITPEYNISESSVFIIKKGSLVYGFKDTNNPNSETYGFLVDSDISFVIPNVDTSLITLSKEGYWNIVAYDQNAYGFIPYSSIVANVPGIPWYTHNGNALVGKIFKNVDTQMITGIIVCDDPYWCDFKGGFGGIDGYY